MSIERDGRKASKELVKKWQTGPYISGSILVPSVGFMQSVHIFNEVCKFKESQLFSVPLKDVIHETWYAHYLNNVDSDPIYLSKIKEKYVHNEYEIEQEMIGDIERMYNNAIKYNKPSSEYGKVSIYRLQCIKEMKERFNGDGNLCNFRQSPTLSHISYSPFINHSSDVSSMSSSSVCSEIGKRYPKVFNPPRKVSKSITKKKRKLNGHNSEERKRKKQRTNTNSNHSTGSSSFVISDINPSHSSVPQSFDNKVNIKSEPISDQVVVMKLRNFLNENKLLKVYNELKRVGITYEDLLDDKSTTDKDMKRWCNVTKDKSMNSALGVRLVRAVNKLRRKHRRKLHRAEVIL